MLPSYFGLVALDCMTVMELLPKSQAYPFYSGGKYARMGSPTREGQDSMDSFGVCSQCGRDLGQKVGTIAAPHGNVMDPVECAGGGLPVIPETEYFWLG